MEWCAAAILDGLFPAKTANCSKSVVYPQKRVRPCCRQRRILSYWLPRVRTLTRLRIFSRSSSRFIKSILFIRRPIRHLLNGSTEVMTIYERLEKASQTLADRRRPN